MAKLEAYIWYEKYRPSSLKDLTLSKEYRVAFNKFVKDGQIPHLLLEGPPGSGKTTVARILNKEINATVLSLNASGGDRGIKVVTGKIAQFAKHQAKKGVIKVVFLDECFTKGSLVKTPYGEVPIEDLTVGDSVCNMSGVDTIDKVVCNKVPIERAVAVHLSNSITTICSEDHKFFTVDGWVKAKYLAGNSILSYSSEYAVKSDSQKELSNEYVSSMSTGVQGKEGSKVLQQFLCNDRKEQNCRVQPSMQSMHKSVYSKSTKRSNMPRLQNTKRNKMQRLFEAICAKPLYRAVLFTKLCGYLEKQSTSYTKGPTQQGSTGKKKFSNGEMETNRSWKGVFSSNFYPYAGSESESPLKGSYSKRDCNEKIEWNFVVWKSWWKWALNTSASLIDSCVREFMGSRICGKDCCTLTNGFPYAMVQGEQLPYQLQSGHSQPHIENRHRGGWERAQIEKCYGKGLKEDSTVTEVRVESVTFYKHRGDNQCFQGVIGSKERNQGFVEFHDLTVNKHPSYIVNGCTVHNSDAITPDAQNALKNTMEACSDNCRFLLTANHVDKINAAIQSRCIKFTFDRFPIRKAVKLCEDICAEEGIENITTKDITDLVKRFYPDMRSVVNNLQAACLTGEFNPKAIGTLNADPKLFVETLLTGQVQAMRNLVAGTSEFMYMYKYFFNEMLVDQGDEEQKSQMVQIIADSSRFINTVPDRELEFISCCLMVMEVLEIKPKF